MNNTIFDVINEVRKALLPLNMKIYKEVKPETETGNCIVLDYMPLKRTNVDSVNDILIHVFLLKVAGEADSAKITTVCNNISNIFATFTATKGIMRVNYNIEPYTRNYDSNYTVTQIRYKIINS